MMTTREYCSILSKQLIIKTLFKETLAEMQVLEDTFELVEVKDRQTQTVFQRFVIAKRRKSKSLNDARQKESNKTFQYCGKTHPMQKELCPA